MSATPAAAPVVGAYAKAPTQVLGRRTVAIIIDALITGGLIVALFFAMATHTGSNYSIHGGKALLFYALSFAIVVLYHTIFEGTTGATVGKAITGVRVRNKDGGRAGLGRALVRNLFRIIDGIFYYLVGWIIAMASGPRRTRLGDMVGGTVVVRSKYA
jgi:uncharacterized RDD family membrane protein YckC